MGKGSVGNVSEWYFCGSLDNDMGKVPSLRKKDLLSQCSPSEDDFW